MKIYMVSLFHRATIKNAILYYHVYCVCSNVMNSVVVTTAPTRSDSELDQPLVISIELNDGSRLVANHKFEYKINPRFSDIEPRNHLVAYVLYERDSAVLKISMKSCLTLKSVSLSLVLLIRLR